MHVLLHELTYVVDHLCLVAHRDACPAPNVTMDDVHSASIA